MGMSPLPVPNTASKPAYSSSCTAMLAGPLRSAPTKAVTAVGAGGVGARLCEAEGWAITGGMTSSCSPIEANVMRGGFRQGQGRARRFDLAVRERGMAGSVGADAIAALALGAIQGAVGGPVEPIHLAVD